MLCKKVLIVFLVFLGTILLLSGGCAKELQNQNEITITTSSDEALQLFLKGRDLSEKLKFPQAAELFDKAIALDKDFALAYLYRANSGGGEKIYNENLSKAVGLLDKVSKGEKHLILYYKSDNSVNAKTELDKLLALYPDDKRVQELVGTNNYMKQDYPNGLNHFKKAVAIDSSFAPIYNMLGYTFIKMEDFAAAEESFQKYIKLIPDEANPYDSYAEFLLTQGKYDESLEQYNKAIQIDPEFITALLGIGNNFIFKKDYDKAREYYQQHYDKSHNINQKLQALYWKAISYIHGGNIVDATKTLDARSQLAFDNNFIANGIYGLDLAGLILAENGNINESEKYLDKAAELIKSSELNDNDRKVLEIYIGLDRCYLQIVKKDLAGAEKNLETLKQVVESRQEPAEIEYLNLMTGILQFNKGNNDLALQYFQKSGKENPYVWYWEAITQEKAGNNQEAKNIYAKIAGYNVNSLNLALVRDRAKNKI